MPVAADLKVRYSFRQRKIRGIQVPTGKSGAMTERKRKQVLVAALDLVFLYASLYLALLMRRGIAPSAADWQNHIRVFRFIFIWWIICFYTAGLYNLAVIFDRGTLARRLAWSAIAATLGTVVVFYVYKAPGIFPKTVLALFAGTSVGLIYFGRRVYAKIQTSVVRKRGVAFVGRVNSSVRELLSAPRNLERLGYEFRLVLDDGTCEDELPEGVSRCADGDALARAVKSGEISLVLIGDEKSMSDETRLLLFDLLEAGAGYSGLFNFYERIFRKTPLEDIDETWFLDNIDLMSKKPYIAVKRLIDVTLAVGFLLLTLPFWPFLALAIRIDSSGPVFFSQTRLGRLAKPFRMMKFRTMRVDGNHQGPTDKDDARITRLGRLFRKSRLDEIPQLLNVLAGDMSFVGPRPERPELARQLERDVPYYKQRLLVKPGVTGWDQVSGEYHSPSRADTFKKLQADLYYVKNLSLSLDMSILFKTVFTVLRASGR